MHRFHPLATLVVALACCTLFHAEAHAQDYDLTIEPLTFQTADGKTVEAERGTFKVPKNR